MSSVTKGGPLLAALVTSMTLGACATVATRPGERLPYVEIEINDTPSPSDDYVSTGGTTPARARIANAGPYGVTTDYPVEITNMDPTAGGQVQVGASCASLAGSVFVTLPATGAWVPLCLQGSAASATDKDAIVEVRENREDGVVLARHALQVLPGPAAPLATAKGVRLSLGAHSTIDDYLAWAPVAATVAIADPAAFATLPGAPATLSVELSNAFASSTSAPRGQLVFGAPAAGGGAPALSSMTPTLTVVLPASGAGVNVYVAGAYGSPSKRDKDAVVQISETGGGVIARAALMVRVRQDGNALTNHQRDRFLRALIKLNGSKSGGTFTALGQNWFNYQDIHNQIGPSAHSNFSGSGIARPAFLPWHRLFILRLERELQAVEPSTSLHYWNFSETDTAKAPANIFNTAFLGETTSGQWVTLGATNPLAAWTTRWPNFATSATVSGIRRFPMFAPTALPTSVNSVGCVGPVGESTVLGYGGAGAVFNTPTPTTNSGFMRMEWRAHNRAHVTGGGINSCTGTITSLGWLTSVAQPIQDPLFFMLHSNVDRLWAKWQQQNNRYDPNTVAAFPNQGVGSGADVGQFTLDPLWPWNDSTAPGGAFPLTVGQPLAPPAQPMILNAVDYERTWTKTGTNPPQQMTIGLGYAYDDVPYGH